jgi:hypothetical protein
VSVLSRRAPTAAAVGAGKERPRVRPWLLAIAGAVVLPLVVTAVLI